MALLSALRTGPAAHGQRVAMSYHLPSRRWQLLRNATSSPKWEALVAGRDPRRTFLWLPDDDVLASACNITCFLRLMEAQQLVLAQVGERGPGRACSRSSVALAADPCPPGLPPPCRCRCATPQTRASLGSTCFSSRAPRCATQPCECRRFSPGAAGGGAGPGKQPCRDASEGRARLLALSLLAAPCPLQRGDHGGGDPPRLLPSRLVNCLCEEEEPRFPRSM